MAQTTTTPDLWTSLTDQMYEAVTQSAFRSSGGGSFSSLWQTVLSRVDRYGYNPMPPNHEVAGLTFITKPKLNLMDSSLQQDRVMATLATLDPMSLPFSIRCYLDSRFSRGSITGGSNYAAAAKQCPFFNSDLPFIVPLSNCLQSITGFPDFNIDEETTEGGFFGEDQAFAKGSDMNMKAVDLSLTFRDIQGGYIMALFIYWTRYIALVTRGLMLAYPEDIVNRRLNYTCSVYRFVLDPSRRYIVKWAKATGCFPKSVPIGNVFNITERENYLHASSQFSIPFKANVVEYMDPIIFRDFNFIVNQYAGGGSGDFSGRAAWQTNLQIAPNTASTNFAGIPYINTTPTGMNELQFWCKPEELTDSFQAVLASISNQLGTLTATPSNVYGSKFQQVSSL